MKKIISLIAKVSTITEKLDKFMKYGDVLVSTLKHFSEKMKALDNKENKNIN